MEFEPFDIGRFLIAPNRRFHCLLIKTELMLEALKEHASIAAKYELKFHMFPIPRPEVKKNPEKPLPS